jgi:EAL domain-containing protein (putative c-di-GMP-specific phosphodiesterase class I)
MLHELFNIRGSRTEWFARALSEERFETWYQPIVDTARRRVVGHECLIRHRTDGIEGRLYTGADVLNAALARNEIAAFDSHARALAVRSADLQRCRARNSVGQSLFFINLLPASIEDAKEAMRPVLDALDSTGLRPADLVFEVVDADRACEPAHLARTKDYIRQQGFGLALDNAGLGSDPTQSMRDLRPDYIKIDRNVSRNIEKPIYAATVRKLVGVGEELGVKVIAGGVERTRTMENLWLLGVEIMQGYLFGPPSLNVVRTAKPAPVETDWRDAGLSSRALSNLADALAASIRVPPVPAGQDRLSL